MIRLTTRLWRAYTVQVRRERRQQAKLARERAAIEGREALIVAHLDMVERIARKEARKFAPWLDIRDLVNAGRVGLVEAAGRYHPTKGSFSKYAYFRVRGAIIDAHRRRAYREELHVSLEGMRETLGFIPPALDTDPGPRPDELAARREQRRQLARAIDGLPGDERRLLLGHLAGEPIAATAEACGQPLGWARATLALARQHVTATVQGRPWDVPERKAA